jgi:hypothetical protein
MPLFVQYARVVSSVTVTLVAWLLNTNMEKEEEKAKQPTTMLPRQSLEKREQIKCRSVHTTPS